MGKAGLRVPATTLESLESSDMGTISLVKN
jgi:hypothetical protein